MEENHVHFLVQGCPDDVQDIHPRNKKDGTLRVHFDHVDGGLMVKGDEPGEFSVYGEDGKWFRDDVRIVGDTVMVSSPEVPKPIDVRYAWQSNPTATLYNGAGLPAVLFRTDQRSVK